jgi:hypothetical protein
LLCKKIFGAFVVVGAVVAIVVAAAVVVAVVDGVIIFGAYATVFLNLQVHIYILAKQFVLFLSNFLLIDFLR